MADGNSGPVHKTCPSAKDSWIPKHSFVLFYYSYKPRAVSYFCVALGCHMVSLTGNLQIQSTLIYQDAVILLEIVWVARQLDKRRFKVWVACRSAPRTSVWINKGWLLYNKLTIKLYVYKYWVITLCTLHVWLTLKSVATAGIPCFMPEHCPDPHSCDAFLQHLYLIALPLTDLYCTLLHNRTC